MCHFCYFNFERNYDVLKEIMTFWNQTVHVFLLNRKLNFDKNETEFKMENPTHAFKDTNLVLQPMQESWIKSKTVMNWLTKEKRVHWFCNVYFVCEGNFFNICVEYTFRIYILLHVKKITSYAALLVFKIFKSHQ